MFRRDATRRPTDTSGARFDRLRPVAVALLAVQLVTFALALPAYEGPDEPFHLGRARAFAAASLAGDSGASSWSDALQGVPLDRELVASLRATPCAPDLRRAVDCPPLAASGGWWNVLVPTPAATAPPSTRIENYQDHQPPLYHAAAGLVLRVGDLEPRRQVLLLRLLAVGLVLLGVAWSLRRLDRPHGWLLVALLFLPGAAEALIRVANDTPVVAWTAGFLLWLGALGDPSSRSASSRARRPLLALVAAVGPLLKLTAIPVVVYAVVDRVRHGETRDALAVLAGGAVALPLQLARGWARGGVLELHAPAQPYDGWTEPLVGIAHSVYTFLKTALWLGGWSVVRPPAWVLAAALVVLLVGLARARPRRELEPWLPHLAASLAMVAGFVAFALGKERLFGVWGAVGGWYFWSWVPWLVLAWQECTRPREVRWSRSDRLWVAATVVLLLAVGVAWVVTVDAVYGTP